MSMIVALIIVFNKGLFIYQECFDTVVIYVCKEIVDQPKLNQ